MGPPIELVVALQRRLELTEFVETGTLHGDTAAWAADHFSRTVTIEMSPEYHAAAQRRFAGRSTIEPIRGDSAQTLGQLMSGFARPLFWLDAHWSGLDTAGRERECPLLAEVAAIDILTGPHAVLVDDARLFCAPPPRPHRAEHWPTLAETVAVLSSSGRRHVVLFSDVFVAVPTEERAFLDCWLQEHGQEAVEQGTLSRFWRKLRG